MLLYGKIQSFLLFCVLISIKDVAMLAYGIILPVGRCWPMVLYYLLVDVGVWYYITCW